jgi:uncharacterized protein (TIGR00369 family)
MKELPHTHSCFVCGDANPRGFKIRSETDGKVVRTLFAFSPEHVGFKQTVHGGLTATVLDEIMTWACAVQAKRFAYCAELNVRYIQPIRPGEKLSAVAELTANRRGRIFETKAELRDASGNLLASATGKYIPLKDADANAMGTDFVGDLGWVLKQA